MAQIEYKVLQYPEGIHWAHTAVTSAPNPPVLIDQNGKSYGYFTANKYKPNRANYELIDKICDNHKRIRKDVGKWYDKLFF